MDDFNVSSLHESKNEWGARLLTILTPLILEGFRSIFDESIKLCRENDEMDGQIKHISEFVEHNEESMDGIIKEAKEPDFAAGSHTIDLREPLATQINQLITSTDRLSSTP